MLDLEDDDLSRLFSSDKWDVVARRIIHGAMFASTCHMIHPEVDHEPIFHNLKEIVANDIVREYTEKHGVYAPVEVDVPPLEKCPTLDEVCEVLDAGEEIPYKAHMALGYGGMHPAPEEHL